MKQYVLNELSKLQLGVEVLDLQIENDVMIFTVGAEQSTIEFLVNAENQFQIKSVVHEGQKYTESEMLDQFNEFVIGIIPIIKPVVVEKINEFSHLTAQPSQTVQHQPESPQATIPQIEHPSIEPSQAAAPKEFTIEEREKQVLLKEEQLKKRALAIQARARLLEFQMQAVDVESHFFDELKEEQLDAKDVKDWLKKGRFIFEWIIMITIALLIVAFLVMNTQ